MERKFEILIVDNDVHLASNLRRILEVQGYNTTVTHDGQTALALCREETFALSLIDIELPSTPGLELIRKLAKLSPLMEYIVITGHASLETAVEVIGLRHVVAYETKPLNMDHLLSLIIQVVERKQLERKMVEYEELNKLKSDLLSTVSHELRTPLAIIKGYSTMLVDYNRRLRPEEKREYLQSINKATDRLTEHVDCLLDMSRLEAGLLKLDKQPASISKLLKKTVAESKLRAPSHKIVLKMTKRLPMLNIDAKRIRQVLDNIIDNAVKYSEEGTTVEIEAQPKGGELQVSVADQGRGIPAKELDKVFDRMHRIEQRLSPDVGGIGLGLAICRGLVEAHGGRIWVESELRNGSTFYFSLPIETTAKRQNYDKER